MSGPALVFREIHRLRRFADDLQENIDRHPRMIQVARARLTQREQGQHDNLETIKKLQVSIRQKEATLKSSHAQILKYEKQRETAASTKEMEAFKHQIANGLEEAGKLEDQILAEMTEVEERQGRIPEFDKDVAQAREEFSRFEAAQNEKFADWKKQLEQTKTRLKEEEAKIPDKFRDQYTRTVTSMGVDAMSPAHGRVCEACRTEMTLQNYHDLQQQLFITCKACGRILYTPETPSVPGSDA
jgi:predicted  nucleic acid-binding Zn-ribbon protein